MKNFKLFFISETTQSETEQSFYSLKLCFQTKVYE